jgi:hypothetical protein
MGQRNIDDEALIRQAKKRLMAHCGWSEEHAYARLRQAAMDDRLSIPLVAERVLAAGKNPQGAWQGLRHERRKPAAGNEGRNADSKRESPSRRLARLLGLEGWVETL